MEQTLLLKLALAQFVNKFPTCKFITLFTTGHHLILSRVNYIQSILSPNFNFSENLYLLHVADAVLTAISMKNIFFCDMTPCSQKKVHRRFGGACHMFRVEEKAKHVASKKKVASSPEDGSSLFLRNVSEHLHDAEFQKTVLCISFIQFFSGRPANSTGFIESP
jgi:hypothetical protein